MAAGGLRQGMDAWYIVALVLTEQLHGTCVQAGSSEWSEAGGRIQEAMIEPRHCVREPSALLCSTAKEKPSEHPDISIPVCRELQCY